MDSPNQPQRRNAPLLLGLTPDEKAAFRAAASRDGMSLSVWLRVQALRRTREVADEEARRPRSVVTSAKAVA